MIATTTLLMPSGRINLDCLERHSTVTQFFALQECWTKATGCLQRDCSTHGGIDTQLPETHTMRKADSQSKIDSDRKKPQCAKCRFHGKKLDLEHHKPCPNDKCRCRLCVFMTCCRKCMAVKTQINRRLDSRRTLRDIIERLPPKPFFDFNTKETEDMPEQELVIRNRFGSPGYLESPPGEFVYDWNAM
ncbi:hypothetical protein CDAR_2821 [Caerostris darwini]|uniref:DM domain-containing protein n=1 Tax=Caerostris darwini TaxID=1538125 RepID=A0AAV4TEA4_9ARAC|nr:hypothetical protein CDAR_2821 [Caerostris darwini]